MELAQDTTTQAMLAGGWESRASVPSVPELLKANSMARDGRVHVDGLLEATDMKLISAAQKAAAEKAADAKAAAIVALTAVTTKEADIAASVKVATDMTATVANVTTAAAAGFAEDGKEDSGCKVLPTPSAEITG